MLGNQLFQYAFSEYLKKKYHYDVLLSTQFLKKDTLRLNAVGLFPRITVKHKLKIKIICKFHEKYLRKTRRIFNIRFQKNRKDNSFSDIPSFYRIVHFYGYWQGYCFLDCSIDAVTKTIRNFLKEKGNEPCKKLSSIVKIFL